MDFQQNTQSEQTPGQNQQTPEAPFPNPMPNQNNAPAAPQPNQDNAPTASQPNQDNAPAAPQPNQPNQVPGTGSGQPPYGNNAQTPYQNQNQPPYGANPYQYHNNNPNGYQNNYPYYNRSAYQIPYAEPGSSLANAAMVLGIISIISCFTFTVYPAFILGSIAIILALLSKGRRPKLFPKARTGIICAVIGLVANTVLITSVMFLLFTDPDVRADVNRSFKKNYGMTFDEIMEEIMEENGYPY